MIIFTLTGERNKPPRPLQHACTASTYAIVPLAGPEGYLKHLRRTYKNSFTTSKTTVATPNANVHMPKRMALRCMRGYSSSFMPSIPVVRQSVSTDSSPNLSLTTQLAARRLSLEVRTFEALSNSVSRPCFRLGHQLPSHLYCYRCPNAALYDGRSKRGLKRSPKRSPTLGWFVKRRTPKAFRNIM